MPINRRRFMKGSTRAMAAAGGGLLGTSVFCPDWDLHAADRELSRSGPAKRCILLFLLGGPSQHSTWDPKPAASAEIRGEFGVTSTSVPGTFISELMPKMATRMHEIALLRAVATGDNAHSSSGYAMLTGQPHQPMNRENANPGAPNDWPTFAAAIQYLRRDVPHEMPPAVRLPHHIFNTDQSVWPGQDSGFLGPASDPWLFRCQPTAKNLDAPEFRLLEEIGTQRFVERRRLLAEFDRRLPSLQPTDRLASHQSVSDQAMRLLMQKGGGNACDLSLESDETRDRYGKHPFGQSVLLGRRLLEAGVPMVQVNWYRGPDEPPAAPCWDSHADETRRLKNALVPPLDNALSALLDDLAARNMLAETLVVCMGEFGRTPKFNPRAGRDHWGNCFSLALAGGGIQGGAVHGQSDQHAAYPIAGKVGPQDVMATMFHQMGYPTTTELRDRTGRPLPISRGRVIREIL